MMIARISTRKRLARFGDKVLLVNTVHDDLEIDLTNDPEVCYNVCLIMEQVFKDIPMNFEKMYGVEFSVPLEGEVSFGYNLKQMEEFHGNKGKEQFKESSSKET